MLRVCVPGVLLLAFPAAAQLEYDAGLAGNPPTAPSPTTQGWSETLTGSAGVTDVSPDPDFPHLNAWQVNDSGSGMVRYADERFLSQQEFEVEVVMRPLAGTLYLEMDGGELLFDSLYKYELRLVGQDVHVVEEASGTNLVCPGAADGYHSFHFRCRNGWDDTEVRYDGVYLGDLPDTSMGAAGTGEGLRWGTLDGVAGRARFHRVRLDLVQPRPVGESYCGPAVPHSGGLPGSIVAFGSPYWWVNDVELNAFDLPTNQFGYFLVSATQDFVVAPGGSQGNLCLGGEIGRYASDVASTGSAGLLQLQIELTALPTSPPSSVQTGDVWNFQAWFRDQNPDPTSNFTDGVSIRF